ncbi:MAG: C39 family peptidase [Phycisphaerales bacterium]
MPLRAVCILTLFIVFGCAPAPRAFTHQIGDAKVSGDGDFSFTLESGPFSEAVPWWNLDLPDGKRASVWLRPGTKGDGAMRWGPWMAAGGVNAGSSSPSAPPWRIDVDTLVGPADAYEIRVESEGVVRGGVVGLTASGPQRETITASCGSRVEISVPFASQKTDDPSLAGRLCSPTSVAMVLAYYGEQHGVSEVAAAAHDPSADIYGNWPMNLQAAYRLSGGKLRAEFRRFSGFAALRDLLERGTPVVISVRGSIRGAPYSPTEGHLLVVTGMNARGDLLVNDPAFANAAAGCRCYRWEDLAVAWLVNAKGTAYVITPREGAP